MHKICRPAFQRYTDEHTYQAYTSRTFDHCTAIFRCTGDYPAMTGKQLKDLFEQIYTGQGCEGCGSHGFYSGKCEVTLNYCSHCVDSGDPGIVLIDEKLVE
ncbi:unnamed protein product, partial [Mesorhabditis belari]|uniref:Uncharacterized protein n=1 Tax=Mesorhabditis belari TaxID=2138241 RepID=A0AAF3FRQ0_9BILA